MKIALALILSIAVSTSLAFKLLADSDTQVAPIAVFAGFGDDCRNPGMSRFAKFFGEGLNTTSKCIQIGSGAASSIFMSFEDQGKAACEEIAKDPIFDGEFSVVGNSQGGLIARYVVEKCQNLKGRVRNMATFGAPHFGVGKFPRCFKGIICDVLNYVVDFGVYWKMIQNHVGPAGYFRDAHHLDYYKDHSTFLPSINNEREFDQEAYERMAGLNKVFLGMFSKDGMIYPPSSAWFNELRPDGSILSFNETELYTKDLLGLKTLYEEGRIVFHEFDGDHLQFSLDDVEEYVFPILAS
ncbi:unnamed protein product [Moneuplotes crassus]|uniref:Palmitoyl-protein thioesterase 1 n=1 Tax=Euplotes crassus TaxID=5936 RepID=A0AAD1XKP0_EUPCR|nr:unnamed protein product [Moneuplotes crassus]